MTLTYPRPYPFAVMGVSELVFTLSRVQVGTRSRGGDVQGAETARTLWSIDAQTPALNESEFEELQGFFDSLRGVLNTFTVYDPARRRPRAYPGTGWAGVSRYTGGAFDGTCTLANALAYQVGLTNLPGTYTIKTGDMISWPWRSTRTLHRAMETVTTTNGSLTVQVEPDIPPGTVGNPIVKLEAAEAVFRLQGDIPRPKRRGVGGEPISFQALQVLR